MDGSFSLLLFIQMEAISLLNVTGILHNENIKK
jgi:hypothetical protein